MYTSMVAVPANVRVIVDDPGADSHIQDAVGVRRRGGRGKSSNINVVCAGGRTATGVPGFQVQGVGSGRNGNPGIDRGSKIAEDVDVVQVEHVASHRDGVFRCRLNVDG